MLSNLMDLLLFKLLIQAREIQLLHLILMLEIIKLIKIVHKSKLFWKDKQRRKKKRYRLEVDQLQILVIMEEVEI